MDKTPKIRKLTHLPLADLEPLLEESRSQGYEFLDRLVAAGVSVRSFTS